MRWARLTAGQRSLVQLRFGGDASSRRSLHSRRRREVCHVATGAPLGGAPPVSFSLKQTFHHRPAPRLSAPSGVAAQRPRPRLLWLAVHDLGGLCVNAGEQHATQTLSRLRPALTPSAIPSPAVVVAASLAVVLRLVQRRRRRRRRRTGERRRKSAPKNLCSFLRRRSFGRRSAKAALACATAAAEAAPKPRGRPVDRGHQRWRDEESRRGGGRRAGNPGEDTARTRRLGAGPASAGAS